MKISCVFYSWPVDYLSKDTPSHLWVFVLLKYFHELCCFIWSLYYSDNFKFQISSSTKHGCLSPQLWQNKVSIWGEKYNYPILKLVLTQRTKNILGIFSLMGSSFRNNTFAPHFSFFLESARFSFLNSQRTIAEKLTILLNQSLEHLKFSWIF